MTIIFSIFTLFWCNDGSKTERTATANTPKHKTNVHDHVVFDVIGGLRVLLGCDLHRNWLGSGHSAALVAVVVIWAPDIWWRIACGIKRLRWARRWRCLTLTFQTGRRLGLSVDNCNVISVWLRHPASFWNRKICQFNLYCIHTKSDVSHFVWSIFTLIILLRYWMGNGSTTDTYDNNV